MSLLRCDALAHRYGDHTVLDGVALDLREGQAGAVLGRSGSGKTTLLLLLGGMMRPQRGAVSLAGVDLGAATDHERARLRRETIGFVFQNYLLEPAATALQCVMLPRLLAGASLADARRDARSALELVEMDAYAARPVERLSGGQRQRIAFARAIAGRPRLVLADEPTGNLDARTAEVLLSLIDVMKREEGTAFLLVTHDPLVDAVLDRAWWLEDGRLEERQPAAPLTA